jgi:hypothetical protein
MNRARHDLLAGTTLAGEEHGGLRRRHLASALERGHELRRLAEDVREVVAIVQRGAQRLDPRLETLRAGFGGAEPALLVREPLMLHGDDDL